MSAHGASRLVATALVCIAVGSSATTARAQYSISCDTPASSIAANGSTGVGGYYSAPYGQPPVDNILVQLYLWEDGHPVGDAIASANTNAGNGTPPTRWSTNITANGLDTSKQYGLVCKLRSGSTVRAFCVVGPLSAN